MKKRIFLINIILSYININNKIIFQIIYIYVSYIFLLNISLITPKEIKILEGVYFNQELQNAIETKTKLFLIFFAKNCDYCGYSVRVLKERVVPNYENEDKVKFGVVNLDRELNFWIGLRFNITEIPFIILIEEGKMFRFRNQFEESNVIKFIDEEKIIEDSLDIPEEVGFFGKVNFFFANVIQKISSLFIKFGFSSFWSNIFTFILLIILFINLAYFEQKLLNLTKKIIDYFKNMINKRINKSEDNKANDNNQIKDKKENNKKYIKNNKEEIKENGQAKPKND